ncbi:MAG: DNA helicase PcrA [Halanaerobiaceae bacterium]
MSEKILDDLNPGQREAVEHKDGPLLVLAGAGSGKTRVLTRRIAYLIEGYDIDPRNILAVTFTNKAADEMKERVAGLAGGLERQLTVSTFHSFCVRILRREIGKLGYDTNFVIFDTADQKSLLKRILKEQDVDIKRYNSSMVLGKISNAKNELITPDDYYREADNYFQEIVAEAYSEYQRRLHNNNALDFDDLIMKVVQLFRDNALVLEYYQDRYQYILIDEYQDVNYAQYRLGNLLAERHRNIFVVGDPDQSIYAFRGADIRNILNFEDEYPEAKMVKLEQNYRSREKILEAAHSVIKNNQARKEKKLWTDRGPGEDICYHTAPTQKGEADYICRQIKKLQQEDFSYGEMAVLYRTNVQSRALEEVFMKYGIPYQIIGGTRFYDRMEIKDIIAYLRVLYNPDDDVSLRRIINKPRRGIGSGTLGKMERFAGEEDISLYEAGLRTEENPHLSGAYAGRVEKFFSFLEELRAKQDEVVLTELVQKILEETGYRMNLLEKGTDQAKNRLENIDELLNVIESYMKESEDNTLGGFLEEVSLLSEVDNLEEDEEAVTLMTLHSAKGLEFPVVFLAGMEEGIFPHRNSLEEEGGIEEERRLCYVGITRAEDMLFLTRARTRMRFGSSKQYPPSCFIKEIPDELLADRSEKDIVDAATEALSEGDGDGSHRSAGSRYSAGQKVVHPRWGVGKVIKVNPEKGELTVKFDRGRPRVLAEKYAPLQKV